MQWAERHACTFTFPGFTVLPLEWELSDLRAPWLGCFFIWIGNGCENMYCLHTTVTWGLVYFTANRTFVSSLVCSVCHPGPVLSVVLASSGSPHNCHLSSSLTYHCSYFGCPRLCIFFVKVKGKPREKRKSTMRPSSIGRKRWHQVQLFISSHLQAANLSQLILLFWESLSWGIALITWACRHIHGAFALLIIDLGSPVHFGQNHPRQESWAV